MLMTSTPLSSGRTVMIYYPGNVEIPDKWC